MLTRIYYFWRIIATGLCFIAFGIGGLLLSIIIFPLVKLLPINHIQKKHLAQYIIHLSFRIFIYMMRYSGVLRITIIGAEKLAYNNQLIIANHPSLIDVVLLISLLAKTDCIVKNALWRNLFLRGVVSSARYMNNIDPEALINDCVSSIKNGSSLVMFPEGTRTCPGQALKFQRGAANIALRTQKNITPVIITCDPITLTKKDKWYNIPQSRCVHMTLKVNNKINITPFINSENITLASRRLTSFLQTYFQQEIITNE